MTDKVISLHALVPMDLFINDFSLRIDLAYACADNLLFGERLYRENVRLWLHEDMARIILLATKSLNAKHNLRLILHDGLRTTDAQALMLETQRVRDNPHWLEEPRLLSSPGGGGHPRGMAVDLSLETFDGALLDMGTEFDFLAEDSSVAGNPAHRAFTGNDNVPAHCAAVIKNRAVLDGAIMDAATLLDLPILLLPEEWWDFRLPPAVTNQYAPLSDHDLPPQMRMTNLDIKNQLQDFPDSHFETLKQKLVSQIELHLH